MKIVCDACVRAEAAVLCCADEAALCRRCDAVVHSANKLAGRHHRVALLPSTAGPSPDVTVGDGGSYHHPEKTGYFFCLEDRALLCRPCDVAVHTAGANVSSHRRFLITGVRVDGVQDHVYCSDSVTGVVSPTSSSGNGSISFRSNDRRSSSSALATEVAAKAAEEGVGRQQGAWSEIFSDGVGMEECYRPAGLSEPGSSSLTG